MRSETLGAMHAAEAEIAALFQKQELALSDDENLDRRQRYFFAVWLSVMDTAVAVKLLLTQKQYPPMYAAASTLLRPMFEKLARGAFIAWCATDDEAETILTDKDDSGFWPVRIGEILKRIHESELDGGWLTRTNEEIGHAMHSAVHGGMRHVQRFYRPGFFAMNASVEEIEEVALLASKLGLLAAAYSFGACGNDASEKVVLPHLERMFELSKELNAG